MSKICDVYEEFNRYIYHLCLKLTRNPLEAEDLMQEVWVRRSNTRIGSK